jgi:predicted ATPase
VITAFHLENLKCYEALSLPLAPLTLLTGFNAGGKSTAVQGALLLAQALRTNGRTRWIGLNGPLVQLGTVGEILNGAVRRRHIGLGVETEGARVIWRLDPEERGAAMALPIGSIEITDGTGSQTVTVRAEDLLNDFLPADSLTPVLHNLTSALRSISFISAIRGGTQEVFPSPDSGDPVHGDVGTRGEFAPWWFTRLSDEDVEEARRSPVETAATLRRQVGAWGSDLFPGFEATAQFLERTGLVQLQLRTRITEDWRRPSNVGYGLSYAFPILVAGLIAKAGQVLIIDSPEAHLHPRAQSRMGRFLATMAASGVRILIETHSDHVLNGVRLAVTGQLLNREDAAIYFFVAPPPAPTVTEIPAEPQVISARIDEAGGISAWPDGFFDQAEKDLAALAGWT